MIKDLLIPAQIIDTTNKRVKLRNLNVEQEMYQFEKST